MLLFVECSEGLPFVATVEASLACQYENMGTSAEQIERDALQFLTSVDDPAVLKEIGDLLGIPIPDTAVGKTNLMLKLLLRYLNSEEIAASDDGGLSLFLKMKDFFSDSGKVDLGKEESSEPSVVKSESGVVKESEKEKDRNEKVKPTFDVLKLKDFKISGTVGGEKKDSLSYSSLLYQINNGKNWDMAMRSYVQGF